MKRLRELHDRLGQSPWIDDLKRSYVAEGELERLIDLGIRGCTSNPTIMAKAIEDSDDYDEQFRGLVESSTSVDDAYWDLVVDDVTGALKIFRPLYDNAGGGDGFVSLEVAPGLAHDTDGTIAMARALHERVRQPNLFVKIPATVEGLPAIEQMIAEGHSINVTLIFSLERYRAVIEAYLSGLERLQESGGQLAPVASVASFFVSRVDTLVDRLLGEIEKAEPGSARANKAHELRGKAALAQARVAYAIFREVFSTERATALLAAGARLQRPLWASTSTKNPEYPDLLYVDGLIGPDTVNTMPGPTVEAFADHGELERTIDVDLAADQAVLDELGEVGVDLAAVATQLEREGVATFAKSFDELLGQLHTKAEALRHTSR